MKSVTIITPCYNEEEVLPAFYQEVCRVTGQLQEYDFEILFVDDGSKDRTLALLKEYASSDSRVKYISFSRNFGKEAAMYAGLEHAAGDYVAFMDADLQDPPHMLPQMLEILETGEYDSVATRRVTRAGEPPVRSFFARMFYRIMRRFSDVEIMDGARDYRLMNRKFVNSLLELREYNRFSKGLFGWVGYKTKWLAFENTERAAGETKWSFWKLFKYSIEGITAFSTAPLVFASVLGLLMCFIGVVFVIAIIIRKLVFDNSVDGWASLVCIISFIGGLQLFALGIVGHYLAKMYLEIKNRPIYLVAECNTEKH